MSVQEALETRRVKIPVVKRPARIKRPAPTRRRFPTTWLAIAACLPAAALALVAGL